MHNESGLKGWQKWGVFLATAGALWYGFASVDGLYDHIEVLCTVGRGDAGGSCVYWEMATFKIFVVLGTIGVALTLVAYFRFQNSQVPFPEQLRKRRELQDIERQRQGLINDAASHDVKISTEAVLVHVARLRGEYRTAGREDQAREVERIIAEFRENNGPEIPIDKAYALMKEAEAKSGQ